MSPLVSVIVPFFNVAELLDECLASIAAQTYAHFECVLVDDGSSDSSAVIAQRWVNADSRFRLIQQSNQGPGPSRNAAMKHISGEYFMFVDGDDLLAPRALEQLLTSLEESGSDFAGAQVWRLPLTRPVEKSFAHIEPFAQFRQRTTIREIPLLMRDRMVWNKLWRRSFWEAGNYEFPDMLFEDFPVLLQAHFDAKAIDTLPDPVYVWRERPKGESISVRGDSLDNVRDRVVAAKMCLDIVDERATPEVRELVHSHLVDVDLREVMNSLAAATDATREPLEGFVKELAQRIDPAMVGLAAPDLQRAYRAARAGDISEVRSIAAHRLSGSKTSRSPLQKAASAPRVLTKRASKQAAGLATKASPNRRRTARLLESRITFNEVFFRIEIPLSEKLKHRARPHVSATLGTQNLEVVSVTTKSGLVCDLRGETLPLTGTAGFQALTFSLTAGPVHVDGPVQANITDVTGLQRAGYWIQACNRSSNFGLERRRRGAVLGSAVLKSHELTLAFGDITGQLVIEQPWPTTEHVIDLVDGMATFDLADFINQDPADNPVTRITSRKLSIRTAGGDEPVYLGTASFKTRISGREVEICAADDGSCYLVHRP